MEIETWIDGPLSSPIPNPLPSEFGMREIYSTGYMGIANSSRKGGINAKMAGERVFGTIFHPYIVGGRFAWCNGLWFVLVCLKIPVVVLKLHRYSEFTPLFGNTINRYSTGIHISSAFYADTDMESHFAFLNQNYFAWSNTDFLSGYIPNSYQFPHPPRTESSFIPASYYETNLGIGCPVKKIPQATLEKVAETALPQLDAIEIIPTKYCWSELPPYLKTGERTWNSNGEDYYGQSKNLAGFSVQQCDPTHDYVEFDVFINSLLRQIYKVYESPNNYKMIYFPVLPDPTWTGIKNSRTRLIDGFQFIEYAFEVKKQPCDIEITVDPALNPLGNDKFCLEYSDYNQLLNKFDNIEQKLNKLPA